MQAIWAMPEPWCCIRTAHWKRPMTRRAAAARTDCKVCANRRRDSGEGLHSAALHVMLPAMIKRILSFAVAAFAGLFGTAVSASAHPHVWVTMRSELFYTPDGKVAGIRHAWTF